MRKPLVAASFCLIFAAGGTATAEEFGTRRFDQQLGSIRFDNWLSFQQHTNDSGLWEYQLRFYVPFDLSGGWTFTQRIDVPAFYTDELGTDNPTGGWKGRVGDAFIEEIFDSPELARNFRAWASVRFVFPTGGSTPFGAPQYQWAPAVGASYATPERGITFGPVARYIMSYHATEPNATEIRTLYLFPILTFALPDTWSLVSYPENGITYDDVTHKWFVPIDLMLIRRTKNVEFGLGSAYGLVKDDPQYKYVIYSRMTLYF